MGKKYVSPKHFSSRTYNQVGKSTANNNGNSSPKTRSVQVKAAVSFSKFGEFNLFPVHDISDGSPEPKKIKLESKGKDLFSFKTDDKRKSGFAVKRDLTAQKHNPLQVTKLPASSIVVKGQGSDKYLKGDKREAVNSPAFHTSSRTASKKRIIKDQVLEDGKQTSSGRTLFFSDARLKASTNSQNRDEDDDFLHVHFKKHPLKMHSRVVTPVVKPDSPQLKKSVSKRKGESQGQKPLAVCYPNLNKQCNKNCAAQQFKDKPDPATKGMKTSTVVFKKELANTAQGTTIVWKPRAQVDVHAKYISQNSKQKGMLVPLASDATRSQATSYENAESTSSTSANTEAVPTRRSARLQIISALAANSKETMPARRSARLQNVSALAANSEGTMPARRSARLQNVSALAANSEETTPTSDGSAITPLLVNSSSTKHATRSRHSKISMTGSVTSSSPLSKAGNISTEHILKSQMPPAVQNVKQMHKAQELGVTQDFMGDVDYLLDSLKDTNPTPVRCLSCLKLAGKCVSPSFRKHLWAHGMVTKIFSHLHDACSDPCLALSTSALMFLLSRDCPDMDLDENSLTLLVRLSEADAVERHYLDTSALKELKKSKQKVMELLTQVPEETHAGEIDLGFISTGNLAMESLLSLAFKRADEWFKEFSPWGLDRLVDFVTACEQNLPEDISQDTKKTLPVLKKLNRCLEFLSEISLSNFDSQNYLVSCKNAALVQACLRILKRCQTYMPSYKVLGNVEENKALKHLHGYNILICMVNVLKVLDAVTFDNEMGNLDLKIETSLLQTIVLCLTTTHRYVPVEKRFKVEIMCLSLLNSLAKHRESNRQIIMTDVKYTETSQPKTISAIKTVVELFVQRDETACQTEEDTWDIDDNELFTQAFGKTGRPVNYLYVASFAGLLLAFTIGDNKEYATAVKKLMPRQNFDPVIKRLKKFLSFSKLTPFHSGIIFNTIIKVNRILRTA